MDPMEKSSDLYQIDHEGLSQRVYKVLKEMILKGELKSGQKLVQDELAERLGVSRTPLLTAMSKLEREMLVDTIPRKGAFVRKLSGTEFVHIYDIRMRLEPLGALEAAQQATDEMVTRLNSLAEEFSRLVESSEDNGEMKEADYRFHMHIMEMSGNQLLYDILSSFNIVLVANLEGLLKEPQRSAQQHKAICRAIRRADPEEAEQAMFHHLLESRQTLIDRYSPGEPD